MNSEIPKTIYTLYEKNCVVYLGAQTPKKCDEYKAAIICGRCGEMIKNVSPSWAYSVIFESYQILETRTLTCLKCNHTQDYPFKIKIV